MENCWTGLRASSQIDINLSESMVRCHAGNRFCSVFPQGSVLGPLLFALYVNELPSLVSSKLLMFVDDIKLYLTIRSPEDCLTLQSDIDTLFNHWLLSFNIVKCKVLHIGNAPYIGNYCASGT